MSTSRTPTPDPHDWSKIDLHHHLDGALRESTILELAREHDVDLPAEDPDSLRDHVTVPPDCRSLTDFLACFETFYPVLQYPDAVGRAAYEVCEDLEADNVLYAETRFAPVLLTEEGASQREVVEAALAGLRRGNRDFEPEVNLILCLYRGHGREENSRTLELAEEYAGGGIVGVDLAGDEANHGPIEQPDLFRRASEGELGLTIHAGEAGPAKNIREALEVGADRIGHGVRLPDDEELVGRVKEDGIVLEVCFTSNLQTRAVTSAAEHPLPEFHEEGLIVTVNTDDPAVSRTTLSEEFRKIRDRFEFTAADCRSWLLNAAEGAFVSSTKKETLKETIRGELEGTDST